MKIIIKAEGDDKNYEIQLSNEEYENYNFISMLIGENEYAVPVDDMYRAFKMLNEQRKDEIINE
jgi:hypothetical protein